MSPLPLLLILGLLYNTLVCGHNITPQEYKAFKHAMDNEPRFCTSWAVLRGSADRATFFLQFLKQLRKDVPTTPTENATPVTEKLTAKLTDLQRKHQHRLRRTIMKTITLQLPPADIDYETKEAENKARLDPLLFANILISPDPKQYIREILGINETILPTTIGYLVLPKQPLTSRYPYMPMNDVSIIPHTILRKNQSPTIQPTENGPTTEHETTTVSPTGATTTTVKPTLTPVVNEKDIGTLRSPIISPAKKLPRKNERTTTPKYHRFDPRHDRKN
jgi:hypothetical protein